MTRGVNKKEFWLPCSKRSASTWMSRSWNWKPSTKTVWKHLAKQRGLASFNAQAALLRRLLEAPELWQAAPNAAQVPATKQALGLWLAPQLPWTLQAARW